MAALAIPLIEVAATALLRALTVAGTAAAGAAAINEAREKIESADRAKDSPIADAGTQTDKPESCTKCPPDCGTLVERNWNMSEIARAYQARITGFVPRTEWSYGGNDFDGFKSQACLLLEAKARYDQFFIAATKPKPFFEITGLGKTITQARSQSATVSASLPARLHWHFMQPLSYGYFSNEFRSLLLPISCFLTP